ncbi:MAG: carboxypeptidase regulatory-like domain-containing protein [Planctomycetes bacterium]|nr:carboxypeptidase regulatory-like domain-containing protein [Planctomycetota bacterium]
MHARELALLCAASVLVAAGGIAFFTQETHAAGLLPEGLEPTSVTTESPAPDATSTAAATADLGDDGHPVMPVAVSIGEDRKLDTSGWTAGRIKGDIQIAVSVLDRIESIHVTVAESRNPIASGKYTPAFHRVVPVVRGRGTPTFDIDGIPFSDHPYVVSVHAPGLNGNRRTLTIDKSHPYCDDIVLSITPGVPLSVLLRDQDNVQFPGLDVLLLPVDEPPARHALRATSDSYGSIVFDNVLAGDYQVLVQSGHQVLLEPRTITVQPGLYTYGRKVQAQCQTLVVPRGVPVRVSVHDRAGYGIGDVRVVATKTDQTLLKAPELPTDASGIADFSHLPPGTWQFSVQKQGFAPWDCQRTIKQGQEPMTLDVTLVPAR